MINWSIARWLGLLIVIRVLMHVLQVPSSHDAFGLLLTTGILALAWSQLGTRGQLKPFLFGVVLYWVGNLFDWFDALLQHDVFWGRLVDTLDDIFFAGGFFFIGLAFIRVMQERDQLENKLYLQAFRDELTALGNRRALFASLQSKLEQAHNGTLLYIDVNHFKPVNDQFGHDVGDTVLKNCAVLLRHDEVEAYRIGGDEFVVLLAPGIDAEEWIAQLNGRVAPLTAQYGVSFSVGTAHFDRDNTCTPDQLLACADQAMYDDKEARRNRRR
jgi:diguanylate cyclase (GGDEF)-like protein